MGFRLKRKEAVADGVRRVAREQAEAAVHLLADDTLDPSLVVHQVRKHCKKLRGLLRLVRGTGDKARRRENAVLRDLAGSLSGTRDADVVQRTWQKVAAHAKGESSMAEMPAIAMPSRESVGKAAATGDERLAAARTGFVELLDRIPDWRIRGRGFDVVREGFETTYRHARRAMRAAASGDDDDFHEWRKHVKDHWYHLRLLQGVWPDVVRAERRVARELAELLGDDHDLSVLHDRLEATRPQRRKRDRPAVEPALRTVDREHRRLRKRARELGSRLFAETPRRRVERLERLWTIWRPQDSPR